MKKLIIEVRMNEAAKQADNAHVAYTPDQIIEDAAACAAAGAAVVHFHARKPDGAESNDVADYREIIAGIRGRCDVMVHPTLGLFHGAAPEQRLAHIRNLSEESNLRPDIAPLDMGSNNLDFWDPEAKAFKREGFVYTNSTEDLKLMAQRLKAWGVKPQLAIWTVANARLMGAFIDAGLLAEPAFPVFFLSGDGFLAGHPATSAGLRAFVDTLPDRRIEWTVLSHSGNILPLAPEIIALGGHISIGLGDYAYPELGRPSNADLVRRVAEISRTMGREVATPQEARELLAA
jgi:3-keto-5-aminohexanoate cleavage enzyme